MSGNWKKTLLALVLTILIIGVVTRTLPPARDPASHEAAASSRLAELLSDDDRAGYPVATQGRQFEFPRDHGPHPQFRNEWWYVTGNLDSAAGKRFGFELTIFRFALSPELQQAQESGSAWRTKQVYIGHFAVTDPGRERFYVIQRFSRGSLGLAGSTVQPLRVWLDDWSIGAVRSVARASRQAEFGLPWRLHAADDDVTVTLTLVPLKAPVLNGIDGWSQKAAADGNASYYYSVTRLATEGMMRIGDEEFAVRGLSWLDREWGSSALSRDQQGWDWFALQLSDGSELMFYNLRRNDGTRDSHSAGTLTLADGSSTHLSRDDLTIDVLDSWESPLGGRYPTTWRLAAPRFDLDVFVNPVLDAQELDTTVRYWEGAVDVTGTRASLPVSGRGYVELTGYADADDTAKRDRF